MSLLFPAKALWSLRKTPVILNGLLNGVTQERALSATDGADGWSVLEVVCHLYDFEEIYTERIRRALVEDNPFYETTDQLELVRSHDYRQQNLSTVFQGYVERRRQHIQLLESLTDEQWEREGYLQHAASSSILVMSVSVVLHDTNHIEQITRALGLSDPLL